ncbi:MAG: flagellar motor protein MotB [Alphaproteobacteria bacterium]|nr:flagellar motor protein MotB [Alphaproteobacteria bacterium]
MALEKAAPDSNKEQDKAAPPPRVRKYGRRMGDNGDSSVWLISFTDVMALMLTFFVLLFAMSHPKEEEWENFSETVQENFNKFQGRPVNRGAQDAVNIEKVNFSKALDLNYLRAIMEDLIEKEPSLKIVKLINQRGGLVVSLPQDVLFDTGKANVKPEASKALFIIAGSLSRIKNRVEVVGHTDPRPITSGRYDSNWHLSLARAANVAAVLENVGYENKVTVRGQAAGRYADIPASLGEIERLDLARRVDIVIMEDDGKRLKLFDIPSP